VDAVFGGQMETISRGTPPLTEEHVPEGYLHLTCEQRCQIYALLQSGHTQAHIARQLGVDPSTISRELVRNSGARGYRFKQAHEKATQRRQEASEKPRKMTPVVVELIEEKLTQEQWSPDQISGRLAKDGFVFVSHERIYQHIWNDKKDGGKLYLHLRHSGKKYHKRRGRNSGRGLILNRVDIDQRPPIVAKKSRIGDWEADTIIGANHNGVVMSHVERNPNTPSSPNCRTSARTPSREPANACFRRSPTALKQSFTTTEKSSPLTPKSQPRWARYLLRQALSRLGARPKRTHQRPRQTILPKRFRPIYLVRCRCSKGRGHTQLSPQKNTRLQNPPRGFLQRQDAACC